MARFKKYTCYTTSDSPPHFIYLMSAAKTDDIHDFDFLYYKVGISSNPDKRLSTLSTASPFFLDIGYQAIVPNKTTALAVEKYLHNKFSSKRVNGEWFVYNDDDYEDIANILCELNMEVKVNGE